LAEKLHALGEALADKAVTPIYATCCAFVGDRGFLHPELTHSATEEEVAELGNKKISIGTSVAIAPVKSV
jgi:D-lactate dehydrogenase